MGQTVFAVEKVLVTLAGFWSFASRRLPNNRSCTTSNSSRISRLRSVRIKFLKYREFLFGKFCAKFTIAGYCCRSRSFRPILTRKLHRGASRQKSPCRVVVLAHFLRISPSMRTSHKLILSANQSITFPSETRRKEEESKTRLSSQDYDNQPANYLHDSISIPPKNAWLSAFQLYAVR